MSLGESPSGGAPHHSGPQHCGTQYSLSDFTGLWAGLGCREKAGVDEEALLLSTQWGRPAVGASGRGMTQATGPGYAWQRAVCEACAACECRG